MPSFDVVNYSLRPNKSIQRQIAFHGMRTFQSRLDLGRMSYVGLGSIWFTDFVMAHKLLDIGKMVSIESDDIGYHRALFNKPYATVRVLHGHSSEVLHTLLEDRALNDLPWVVWLDYDRHFEEVLKSDVRSVIERAPRNTILLVTFNGKERHYGRAKNRPGELRELFGDVVPDKLSLGLRNPFFCTSQAYRLLRHVLWEIFVHCDPRCLGSRDDFTQHIPAIAIPVGLEDVVVPEKQGSTSVLRGRVPRPNRKSGMITETRDHAQLGISLGV